MLPRTALLVVLTSLCAWGGEPPKAEEEVDLDALVAEEAAPTAAAKVTPTRVPEHDFDRRLLAFPLLLVVILAWNVTWKPALPTRRT